jgi:ATP-dependent exoDNAse (exonuclease V) alpha subunit
MAFPLTGGPAGDCRRNHPSDPRLNAQQREAVVFTLRNCLSLLSGGVGTGKTFTIRTVVRTCLDCGLRVEWAAPIGKAADCAGQQE